MLAGAVPREPMRGISEHPMEIAYRKAWHRPLPQLPVLPALSGVPWLVGASPWLLPSSSPGVFPVRVSVPTCPSSMRALVLLDLAPPYSTVASS